MSYTKITDYAAKDNLLTGNPNKVIKGTELGAEFDAIVTADALNLKRDGSATVSANLPMNSKKLTGLADGSALTDSVSLQQVQYGFGSFLTSVAGTNTITATATPTPAYTVGQRFTFIPAATNTGAVTLNISSVGAGAVQWKGAALIGGELVANLPVTVYVSAATPVFEIIGSGGSLAVAPTASVAAHATTCDVWTARETILTGTAVTFTDIPDAPYVGAVAWVYMNATHTWTDGAVFDVQGGANYTAAVGDWVRINAVTVSTFDVMIFKASGTAASGANSDITSLAAVTALTNATGVDIKGTNTNDSAAAGNVGEFVSGTVASGSAVGLTSATGANVTSISLTAGDWDVSGNIIFIPAATTSITALFASSSSTSATVAADYYRFDDQRAAYVPAGGGRIGSPIPTQRFSLSGTTTIYLVAQANFTVSTLSAYGFISARRVR